MSFIKRGGSQGNRSYVLANDAASLEAAFSDLFDEVLAQSTTFSAPGIAVNTFDRLNHLDSLYFAVFQPAGTPQWAGNLKRYKLGVNVDADGNKQAVILDQDGDEAVDSSTGFFKDSARSWWSPSTDGKNVNEGGVASQHDTYHANREVYTYLGSDTDLTDEVNEISVANIDNLTKALLGDDTMDDGEHSKLINWIRGADVDGEDATRSRKFVSDPLHSVPHLIVYGGTEDSPDTAIYFGDNQGFIHGINGSTGKPTSPSCQKNSSLIRRSLWRPRRRNPSATAWMEKSPVGFTMIIAMVRSVVPMTMPISTPACDVGARATMPWM